MASGEGYYNLYWRVLDSGVVDPDSQIGLYKTSTTLTRIRNCMFIIAIIIFTAVVMVRVFICVVVASYLKNTETQSGMADANPAERGYIEMTKYIIKKKIKKKIKITKEIERRISYKIVSSCIFEFIIYVIVLANII